MFILQLNQNGSGEWIEISPAGDIVSQRVVASLSDCPKINAHDALVMLVPGEQVTITSVTLPRMRASERATAAPFALEEQLASDPESVYVAMGESQRDGAVTVAVLDKDEFEKQLQQWQEVGLYPTVATPDFLGMSWEPETWTIVIHRQMAWVRTGTQSGFSVDVDNLVLFLKLLLEKESTQKPKKVICWQEENILPSQVLDHYAIPIEWRDASSKNKFDVQGLMSSTQLNLLQGKYRPKIQSSALEKNWMRCGIAAAALVGFLFFGHIVQWIYLHHQANELQTQVVAAYQQLFPGSKSILEPRFRTEALLKRYESASRSSLFLKLFRASGTTLLRFPQIQVQSINFTDHQLQLTVDTNNMTTLSQWTDTLRAEHVSVRQNVLKSGQNTVNAQIIIGDNNA